MEEQIKSETTQTEQPKHTLPPKITRETLYNANNTKKDVFLSWAKSVFLVFLSAILVSFTAYVLIEPNQFTIGGVSGIAILANVATNKAIPQSIILICLNAPLVITSFFFVKKKFAILSLLNILLQYLAMMLFEEVFPDFQIVFGNGGEKIFAAIASGLCIGLSITLAFKAGGSTGGADIAAVMIQKKMQANSIAWLLFIFNCTVIGASIFVYYDKSYTIAHNLMPIMLAIFESYIESRTFDSLSNGVYSAVECRIITDKPDEIANALMSELSRGATLVPAQGMYTKENHAMIICVINKRQITMVKKIIKTVDPNSFAIMSHASHVIGLGFYAEEN